MTHILIIDDSPEDREFISDLIESGGRDTSHSVCNGAEAISYMKEHDVDCVMLDYHLDGEDGISVTYAIRPLGPTIPIIMMTVLERDDLATLSLESGASVYVLKQKLTTESLRDIISEAMRQKNTDMALSALKSKKTRVMLVEDNADDREQIAWMLSEGDSGFEVDAVATGLDALAHFDTIQPDCVILDYRLETEDGVDILAQFKQRALYCPVIMLTGQGNEEVAATAIKLGAADYLIKQRLSKTYLATAVQNAISRSALEAKVATQEAERRQFLNILVHDLREPLRNVSQMAEIAVEDVETSAVEDMKEMLNSQMTVANRANDLLGTLNDYAMLDGDVAFTQVSLTDAAIAAKDNLKILIAEKNAEVEIADLPYVTGHFPQLVQLFQNLIGNGIKYNLNGTPKITLARNGVSVAGYLISLTDNGVGIPAKDLEEVFRPLKRFWRQDEFEGTGLGLAICQKIMERHKGRIWCSSVENEGSSFNMVFPIR
ncbi:MAG: response regulator [Sulfitobacter sp.]